MCGLSIAKFSTVFAKVEAIYNEKWTSGRGHRSKFSIKDIFLLVLVTLKHASHLNVLGRNFRLSNPTFERAVINFRENSGPSCMISMFTSTRAFLLYLIWLGMLPSTTILSTNFMLLMSPFNKQTFIQVITKIPNHSATRSIACMVLRLWFKIYKMEYPSTSRHIQGMAQHTLRCSI